MTKSNPQRTFAIWMLCAVLPVAGIVALGFLAARSAVTSRYGSDEPQSGWGARWVGDVNADGTPDFVLSTPFDLHHPSPRLISGASGLDLGERAECRVIWDGRASPDDLDGDGHAETWHSKIGGELVLSSARTPTLNRTFVVDRSGLRDVLDDLDGDGIFDLLIGGYPATGARADRVSAVSARTGAVIWTVQRATVDATSYDPFAWNGCIVGDVDGDGIVDAAVQGERERVEFLSGRDGTTLLSTEAYCEWITGSLSPLGDQDGDGRPEVLVYRGWRGARAEVLACVDGRVLRTIAMTGDAIGVFSPGDIDGDGLRDVAWSSSEGGTCARASDGSEIGQWPGVSLMPSTGDHDGDGHMDLLAVRNVRITNPRAEVPDDLWRQGRVEIISGKALTVVRVFDADALGLPR